MAGKTHFSSKKELTQYVQDQANQLIGFSDIEIDLKLPKLNNDMDTIMPVLFKMFKLFSMSQANSVRDKGKGIDLVTEKGEIPADGKGSVLALEEGEISAEGKGAMANGEGSKGEKEKVIVEKGERVEIENIGSENWPEVGVEKEVVVIGVKGPTSRGRSPHKHPSTTPRRRNISYSGKDNWNIAGNTTLRRDMLSICNRIKELESQVDENSQRLRKATLVASSSDLRGLKSELKKIQQDDNSDASVLERVLFLIKRKYGIEVSELEIFANHWLPNGSYILKFVYRNTDNSCWQRLIEAMRKGGDKTFNFYLNFNLTRKRQSLFRTVRKLKYDGKIALWSVDCNGTISIMHLNEQWRKLTHHYSKEGDLIPTYTEKGVLNLFD